MYDDARLNEKGRSLSTRVAILEAKVRLVSIVVKWIVGTVLVEGVGAVLLYIVLRR